jgi:hypothetical protein
VFSRMRVAQGPELWIFAVGKTAQPLPLGATVRLRGRDATGVIIGNSPDIERVRVQWDDTGEVTHCLCTRLVPAR